MSEWRLVRGATHLASGKKVDAQNFNFDIAVFEAAALCGISPKCEFGAQQQMLWERICGRTAAEGG